MNSENEKTSRGLANLANLANSTLERAKQAPSQRDETKAEQAPRRDLRVYRYRLTDFLDSELTLIAPGTSLAEAEAGLRARYGTRLVDVVEWKYTPGRNSKK